MEQQYPGIHHWIYFLYYLANQLTDFPNTWYECHAHAGPHIWTFFTYLHQQA
jgi:hypothetical protein